MVSPNIPPIIILSLSFKCIRVLARFLSKIPEVKQKQT